MCEICDNFEDDEEKIIMLKVKKIFSPWRKYWFFNNEYYITMVEISLFHIAHVIILGKSEYGKTRQN